MRHTLDSLSIVLEVTPPYSHESNGVAEHLNRTIKQMVRAMLLDIASGTGSSFEKYLFFWAEAVHCSIYIKNWLPHKALAHGSTPFEALFKKRPSVGHMRTFGSHCYVHVAKESRLAGTQLFPRALEGLFVGHESTSKVYRVYIPTKRAVVASNQVRFAPAPVSPVPSIPASSCEVASSSVITVPCLSSPSCPIGTRFNRNHYKAFDDSLFLTYGGDELRDFAAAIHSPDQELWLAAIQSELDAPEKNEAWEVVPIPTERRNIVDCNWVFKHKLNADGQISRYKAQPVVKGFSLKERVDFEKTFALVVNYDSLRLLLALLACNGWKPHQLDVKSAFLHGNLSESIFMQLPPSYRRSEYCAKLKKCLYGLKQSPR